MSEKDNKKKKHSFAKIFIWVMLLAILGSSIIGAVISLSAL